MGISTAYFTSLTEAINSCNDCDTLNRISTQGTTAVNSLISNMTSQIAILTPILTAPTGSFGSIIAWITSLIAIYQGPITEMIAEKAALTSQLATLTSAINAKKAALGC